ncbi:MAG: hypothetical protein KA392_10275 [Candidatus Obscuribacter sp.]|jgi:hypothetical protein|nr:hypothetical protein [Candidatus Obscuribacter sp.]MBK7838180.1 hypothetical protein [Candidatus Obscuribacter sp.]MBK9203678.1 hypothetical protein [Candidatus Obscuribacter sp.]MBK9621958.1 hypothetical protein [Candidatus Obscuribacter sp.]MBP6349912.1 hypothetical protein [Candidatus Obscuribacter sp.]
MHDQPRSSQKSSQEKSGTHARPTNDSAAEIGILLVMAGIIDQTQLAEAENMAKETGMDIGKMLAMSGFVKKNTMTAAIEAHKLIKEANWDKHMMAHALSQVHANGGDLAGVLSTMSQTGIAVPPPRPRTSNTPLSELLLAAGILSQNELNSYLATVNETGLPLGRVINHAGVVKMELVLAALSAQVYERSGFFEKQTLIELLTLCNRRGVTFEVALQQLNLPKPPDQAELKLGEILVQAGIISQSTVITAIELGLMRSTQIGQELVTMGQLQQHILDHALKVQSMVTNGWLASEHAAASLRRIALNGENPAIALGEIAAMVLSSDDFDDLDVILSRSGACSDMDLVPLRVGLSDKPAFIEYLGAMAGSKIIDDSCALCAARLLYLVRMDVITSDRAVALLKHALANKMSADEAMVSAPAK